MGQATEPRKLRSHSAPTAAETLDDWIDALTSELRALDPCKEQDRVNRLAAQVAALIERRTQVGILD